MELCKPVSLRLIFFAFLCIATYAAKAENNAKTIEPIEQQKRSARSAGEKSELPANPSAVDKDLDYLPKNKRQVGGLYRLCLQRCVLRSNSPFCDACIELIKDIVPTPRRRFGGSALSGRYLGCQCTREENHVCGVNGYTYENPCFAACARATIAYYGNCRSKMGRVYGGYGGGIPGILGSVGSTVTGVVGNVGDTLTGIVGSLGSGATGIVGDVTSGLTGVVGGIGDTATGIVGSLLGYPNRGGVKMMGRESPLFCGCTREYRPVCGVSGTTHSNECIARCNGDMVRFSGQCRFRMMGRESPVFCGCTKEYRPVCGVSGTTHSNECIARCNGDTVRFFGRCRFRNDMMVRDYPPMCTCPLLYWPVCGVNGVKYDNQCELNCAGVGLAWSVYQPDGDRECYPIRD